MNVRQKLLGGYLVVALMVAATALIAWYTDQTSARRAATIEAAQVARGIGKDIVFGLPGTVTFPEAVGRIDDDELPPTRAPARPLEIADSAVR